MEDPDESCATHNHFDVEVFHDGYPASTHVHWQPGGETHFCHQYTYGTHSAGHC